MNISGKYLSKYQHVLLNPASSPPWVKTLGCSNKSFKSGDSDHRFGKQMSVHSHMAALALFCDKQSSCRGFLAAIHFNTYWFQFDQIYKCLSGTETHLNDCSANGVK